MTRCDNDECPLSKQCTRFLIYPTDADGLETYKPRIITSINEVPMIQTTCDYFIELAVQPDNLN